MSPNYDSLPLQELILKHAKGLKQSDRAKTKEVETPQGVLQIPDFKLEYLYKTDEWMFLKRGFDDSYCRLIYHMRLMLNKTHGESDKVRDFRFCLALDDEIDIRGSLIREVCLTWRNKNISWIQLVQDITNLDCAVRNSAPLFFFGYSNFPHRREQIVRNYLAPYLIGKDVKAKMDTFLRLTENKCFIFMNHRLRKAFHINTTSGDVTELRELTTQADHEGKASNETQDPLPSQGKEVVHKKGESLSDEKGQIRVHKNRGKDNGEECYNWLLIFDQIGPPSGAGVAATSSSSGGTIPLMLPNRKRKRALS